MNITRFLAIGIIVASMGQMASADWGEDCKRKALEMLHHGKLTYMRNAIWPHPFREFDAMSQRQPFAIMAHNGWRLHHTLSHNVFRSGDAMLTAVGRNQVHWIATQSPQHRRYIYVLQGATQQETDRRVESVNEALTHVLVSGAPPQVMVTSRIPSMASGEYNTQLSRARRENMLAPVLMEDGGGGGGGGGGN